MKKLTINSLKTAMLFSLSFLLFTSCSQEKKQQEKQKENIEVKSEITTNDIEEMRKNHIISREKASHMYKLYTKDRVELLNETLKKMYKKPDFKDTRNVWFDIKSMKAYIKHLEDKAGDFDGIQIYFAVNTDGDIEKNHQTVFIAPTKKNNGVQSGFTIVNGKVEFLNNFLSSQSKTIDEAGFTSLLQNGDDEESLIFNEGNDSPPNGNN